MNRAQRSAAHRKRMAATQRRNAKIVALYREGALSQREIAERFGISPPRVSMILASHNARDPECRRKIARQGWEIGRYADNPGRPRVWPDVPPEVEPEYRRLRKTYGIPAVEARRMLEGRIAA